MIDSRVLLTLNISLIITNDMFSNALDMESLKMKLRLRVALQLTNEFEDLNVSLMVNYGHKFRLLSNITLNLN